MQELTHKYKTHSKMNKQALNSMHSYGDTPSMAGQQSSQIDHSAATHKEISKLGPERKIKTMHKMNSLPLNTPLLNNLLNNQSLPVYNQSGSRSKLSSPAKPNI